MIAGLILLALPTVIGLAMLRDQLPALLAARASEGWRPVRARLRSVRITADASAATVSFGYAARVRYTYTFNGATYEGRTLSYRGFLNTPDAEVRRVRDLAPDSWVTAYVDPERPERAVLVPGAGVTTYLRVAVALACFVPLGWFLGALVGAI